MSLVTVIESLNAKDDDFKNAFEILRAEQPITVRYNPNTHLFGILRGRPFIEINIHDYLSDEATFTDDTLCLVESGKTALEKLMSLFLKHYKHPFYFWSGWESDSFNAKANPITPAQLQHLLHSNTISQKQKYKITN